MNKKEIQLRKNDIFLIIVLLAAAILGYVLLSQYGNMHTKDAVAVITVDGEEYARYPLTTDVTKKISFEEDDYNVFVIKDGYAQITDASCPDQICVSHKKISKTNETIVCLPHKLAITIENGFEAEMDIFVQ